MSTQIIRMTCCDRPGCEATTPKPDDSSAPDGWKRICSSAHIPSQSGGYYARRNRNMLTTSERSAGTFFVDLCPDDHDAISGHHPVTDGRSYGRHDSQITVSCECGAKLGTTNDGARGSEARWTQHLAAVVAAAS